MTDFTVDQSAFGGMDTRWRASKHGQANGRPGTLDVSKFISGTHYNIADTLDVIPSGVAVGRLTATELYAPWAPGTNEVQTVVISATGGTFTLTFGGATTSAIAYNASPAQVQAALVALSSIGDADVVVSGVAGSYVLSFKGALGFQDVATLTSSGAALTGGAGTVTHGTTTAGASGASDGSEILAGYINDDEGIPVKRPSGVTSTKSSFSLLVHGIINPDYLPVAAQAAAVRTANASASFVYVD